MIAQSIEKRPKLIKVSSEAGPESVSSDWHTQHVNQGQPDSPVLSLSPLQPLGSARQSSDTEPADDSKEKE